MASEQRERSRGHGPTPSGLIALAAALLAFFLLRYPIVGFRLPMGPDAPVYMWWAARAAHEGLSVANWRPGAPALTLMLGGALGLDRLHVVAGLGAALAATVGLAGAAVARAGRGEDTVGWPVWVAGLLAGTFASHLAGGYLGNIALAGAFLAAIALLSSPEPVTGRGTIAAALVLGAGGLAHPLFFLVCLLVLLAATPMLAVGRRGPVLLAAAGAGALTGAGLLAMLAGPRPLPVDTSADAFLRRNGLADELHRQFLQRLGRHWLRYVPWVSAPLAWFGARRVASTPKRLLAVWTWVCVAGVAASFVVWLIPGVRMMAFAFGLPILAAFGLRRVAAAIPNRLVAAGVVTVLAGVMVGGAAMTWSRERPYANEVVVGQVRALADDLSALEPDTPLVFVVEEPDEELVAFRVTNAGNVIRAYVEPSRLDNVHLFVGDAADLARGQPTLTGGEQHDALSRTYLEELTAAGVEPDAAQVFVLPSLNHGAGQTPDGATPSLPSPWMLAAAGVLVFALLAAAGWGWGLWVTGDAFAATAFAPAFGVAALILAGVALDRLGLRLDGVTPAAATLVVGLAGYILAWRRRKGDDVADGVAEGGQRLPGADPST